MPTPLFLFKFSFKSALPSARSTQVEWRRDYSLALCM